MRFTQPKPSLCSFYLSTDVPATLLCLKVHHGFILLHIMVLLCFAYIVYMSAYDCGISLFCLFATKSMMRTKFQRRRYRQSKNEHQTEYFGIIFNFSFSLSLERFTEPTKCVNLSISLVSRRRFFVVVTLRLPKYSLFVSISAMQIALMHSAVPTFHFGN